MKARVGTLTPNGARNLLTGFKRRPALLSKDKVCRTLARLTKEATLDQGILHRSLDEIMQALPVSLPWNPLQDQFNTPIASHIATARTPGQFSLDRYRV